MVTSIILIDVERHKINDAAQQLASMGEISEVFSVSGNYDIVAIVRVTSNDELADLVTSHLIKNRWNRENRNNASLQNIF